MWTRSCPDERLARRSPAQNQPHALDSPCGFQFSETRASSTGRELVGMEGHSKSGLSRCREQRFSVFHLD